LYLCEKFETQVAKHESVCWPSHLPLWRKSASWRSGVCVRGDVYYKTKI